MAECQHRASEEQAEAKDVEVTAWIQHREGNGARRSRMCSEQIVAKASTDADVTR